jgi:hypothetical protein
VVVNDTDAWLSILAGLVVAYRRPSVNGRAVAQHLIHLLPTATPTFKRLKVNQKLYANAIRMVGANKAAGRGGMPSNPYANALLALNRDLSARRKDLKTFLYSRDVTKQQQQLAGLLKSLLIPDTATVGKKEINLDKKLSLLPDKMIRGWMVPQKIVNEQPQHIDEARHILRRMGTSDSLVFSVKRRQDLNEQDPKRYKRLSEVLKAAGETWKNFVRFYVRKEGKHVRIVDLLRAMQEEKITYNPFDQMVKARLGNVRIDEDGKLYTPDDHQLSCGIPPIGSKIKVNPKFEHDPRTYMFLFQVPGTKARGTLARRVDVDTANRGAKFDKVMKTIPLMPKIRPRWLKDLSSSDPVTRALAAMAEIAWETAMRIGSEGNKKDDAETYGLSTLLVGQVNINSDVLILTYPGKDNIPQRHVLRAKTPEHKRAIAIMNRLRQGKRKNDWLWTDQNGNRLAGPDVNAYLRSVGFPATIHKFRHIRGTMLMQDLLGTARIPKNATLPQVESHIKKLAVDVGALLGHKSGKINPETGQKEYTEKAMTAIKNYIVPQVLSDVFDARKMRVPDWIPKIGRGSDLKLPPVETRVRSPLRDRIARPIRPEGRERIPRDVQPQRRHTEERPPRAPTRPNKPRVLDLDF